MTKIAGNSAAGLACGGAGLVLLLGLWYAFPVATALLDRQRALGKAQGQSG